jgi:hypothetical protein
MKAMFLILGVMAFGWPWVVGYTIRPLQYAFTSISTQWIPFDPELHRLSEGDAEALEREVAALERLGFVRRGRARYQSNAIIVAEFLDAEDGREWATISIQLTQAGVRLGEPSVGLSSHFQDGHVLIVANDAAPYPFDDGLNETRWRLPSVRDPELLLRAFRFLVQRRGDEGVRPTPLTEAVHERATRRLGDLYHDLVKRGWFTFNAASGAFRPTFAGAYRAIWATLPPWRSRRHRKDLERERALLEELGIPAPKGAENETPAATTPEPSGFFERHPLLSAGLAAVLLWFALRSSADPLMAMRRDASVEVPANLVAPDSFADAVRLLETVTGSRSHPLIGSRGGFGISTVGAAISMRSDSAAAYVHEMQDAFAAKGMLLFRTTEVEPSPGADALALYPGTDPYVVMRAMGTDAANHGMDTEEVIAWFTREAPRYPIRFEAIALDYVRGTILGDVPDATEFAKRFLEFCPDLQSDGFVSARRLGREFKKDRALYCWWD